MTDESPILVETQGPIEILTLNRPEALNALNPALVEALLAYFQGLHDRPEIRVVLMRGAGRGFGCGQDRISLRMRP